MRRRRGRRFPARYRKSGGSFGALRRWGLLAGAALLAWLLVSEIGLSSVSGELAREAAHRYLQQSVNRAAREALEDGDFSFVTVLPPADGGAEQIAVDTAELNRVKARVLERLEKDLDGQATASVSLGSLFPLRVFNGRGPKVPVRLDLEGSANVSFSTGFQTAGINQSCHRVVMEISAEAHSQSARFETPAQASASVVLAETVLVGEVPRISLEKGE